MNLYPILLSIAASASTFLGGLLAAKYRDQVGRLAAFSAGVLIAVPLFDLLPESFKLATQSTVPLENVMYVTALGFLFLYVLERYFSVHRACEDGVCRNVRHPRGGLLGAAELSVHSFVDGFAIGLGFQVDVHLGIIITVAVISHDFADGINTVTVMMNSGNSSPRCRCFSWTSSRRSWGRPPRSLLRCRSKCSCTSCPSLPGGSSTWVLVTFYPRPMREIHPQSLWCRVWLAFY